MVYLGIMVCCVFWRLLAAAADNWRIMAGGMREIVSEYGIVAARRLLNLSIRPNCRQIAVVVLSAAYNIAKIAKIA